MWRTKKAPVNMAGAFSIPANNGYRRYMTIQLIKPNPNIPCEPGWCLAYVNEAFGVRKRFPTAMSAWLNSGTKHTDYDFPQNVWVPLWFSLKNEPAGHVALLAPDGSVYSTTHPTSKTPTKHPNLADLILSYSYYNPLTYLGWTEDVEGTPVIDIRTMEETMAKLDAEDLKNIYHAVWYGVPGAKLVPNELTKKGEWPYTTLGSMTARISRDVVRPALKTLPGVSASAIADSLVAELGEDFAKTVVSELGKRISE